MFRTTYYQTTLDSKNGASFFDKEDSYFAGIGLSYDDGSLLAISEFAVSDVEGNYSDTKSG